MWRGRRGAELTRWIRLRQGLHDVCVQLGIRTGWPAHTPRAPGRADPAVEAGAAAAASERVQRQHVEDLLRMGRQVGY